MPEQASHPHASGPTPKDAEEGNQDESPEQEPCDEVDEASWDACPPSEPPSFNPGRA